MPYGVIAVNFYEGDAVTELMFSRLRKVGVTQVQRNIAFEQTPYPYNYNYFPHRSLILEACSEIWKFGLQRDNDVEV